MMTLSFSKRFLLGLAVMSFTIPTFGLAASVPDFSYKAYCKEVAESVGGSYQIEEGCVINEEDSISAIQSMDVPDRIMNYCTEVAESIGGSYQILHGCIQNELESKANLGE